MGVTQGQGAGRWLALTPLSMVCVWHRVPSAAGMLLVMHRLLLLRHHNSLQTSCGPRRLLKLAFLPPEDPGDRLAGRLSPRGPSAPFLSLKECSRMF